MESVEKSKIFRFSLVSPEKMVLEQDVEMVVIPGAEGDFGVLARHVPYVAALRPGIVSIYATREEVPHRVFITGGFAHISLDHSTVLANHVEDIVSFDGGVIAGRVETLRREYSQSDDPAKKAQLKQEIEIEQAKYRAVPNI